MSVVGSGPRGGQLGWVDEEGGFVGVDMVTGRLSGRRMSSYDLVVVSVSPSGRRAAKAAASAGRRVVLVLPPGGVDDPLPEVPVDNGLLTGGDPTATALLTALVGPVQAYEPARAVLRQGRLRALPLARRDVMALLPAATLPPAATAWARARAASELARLLGGGVEQRSYRDWVVQRFGEPVYTALFARYGERRFGPPAEVVCGVARVHHGLPRAEYAASQAFSAGRVEGGYEVVRAELTGITNGGLDTAAGRFEGPIWADLPPAQVIALLGAAASEEARVDASHLVARHAVEVVLRGGQDLPFETHLLDADGPFYRVVRPGLLPAGGPSDRLVVHANVADADSRWSGTDGALVSEAVHDLEKVGVTGVSADSAVVRRLRWHAPVWRPAHLTRLRNHVLGLDDHGVTPIGRVGLTAWFDAGGEASLLAGLLAEEPVSARELVRLHVEPPVLDGAERARLTTFITR
jgi:hypothetical protein